MTSIRYTAARTFRLEETPQEPPAGATIRIAITQVGFCATDLHVHTGGFHTRYPLVPGHEIVGTVDAVGSGCAGDWQPGQQVVVNPNVTCGRCAMCREGRDNDCTDLGGIGTNVDGGFASSMVVDERLVHDASDLPPDVAVLAEPTACAVHGAEVAQVRVGSTALVLGAGPTGLLLAQVIKAAGAARVVVAAPSRAKLDRARALGIAETVPIGRDPGEAEQDDAALRDLTGGEGFDLVVEATGAPSVLERCPGLARTGGTVLVYGVADAADRVPFRPYEIFRRELTVKGSFAQSRSFPAALALLRSGQVRTEGLITHRFALADYGELLDRFPHDPTIHKAVVHP